jgi:hypothetical protein
LDVAQTESQRDYQRRYAAANAERKRAAAQAWRDKNPERSRLSRREYYARNRDQIRAKERERSRTRIDPRDALRNELKAALWAEQGERCYLCEELVSLEEAFLDHDHRCCPESRFCRFCVRGVVHPHCNVIIGMAFELPERLERAARNLRLKLAETDQRLKVKAEQLSLDF